MCREVTCCLQLHVSRDDGRSFLPAVFPGKLQETRYTIMDQDDGTVFVSVEHKQNDEKDDLAALLAGGGATLGDVYASVADGELLFKDDFENGLTKWRGTHGNALPERARIVSDPLCDKKGEEGCRGKVMKMTGCATEGDAFSLHAFTCSLAFPCKVSLWVLGSAWQGFSASFPGSHIWSAAGDDKMAGVHKKIPMSTVSTRTTFLVLLMSEVLRRVTGWQVRTHTDSFPALTSRSPS